jgi:hypothetical protein
MDAATLYIVVAVGSGPKRMSTSKFPTMEICKEAADKLRKRASIKDATYYCVRRDPDKGERRAAQQAAAQAAAARKRRMQQQQAGQGQGQGQQASTPAQTGLPRDFYTGTVPKM